MSDQALSSLYTETTPLTRPRIRQIVGCYAALPLILVDAPAGYGKTVAVDDYLRQGAERAIWLALSPRDNEPVLFLRHLCESFRQSGQSFSAPGGASLANNYSFWNLEEQFRRICAEKPLHLVLDNYHHIEDSQIDRFVEDTARLRIENLHIYVLTRSRPGFSVTDLLLKNVAGLLDAEELRFTPQEIAAYLDSCNMHGGLAEAERVFRHTEGWPAAIRLLANSKNKVKDNKKRFNQAADISNLFEKEIFSHLDQNTRTFLLRVCILDEFPVRLAAHVSGFDSAARILHNLANNSLLASYDADKNTYFLNRVFLDYLRRQNRLAEKQELQRQHQLAGDYYLEKKNYAAALKYFLEIEDYDKMAAAIALFLRQGSLAMRQNSRVMLDCITKMPREYAVKYPAVGLCYALCCLALNDDEACREALLDLRDTYLQDIELPFSMREKLLAEIELLQALLEFNQLPRLVERSQRALRMLGGERFSYQIPMALIFGAPSPLLTYHAQPGSLAEELEQIAENSGLLHTLFGNKVDGLSELLAAEAAYWRGRLEDAEELATRAAWLAERSRSYDITMAAQFTLLRCAMQRGALPACQQALAEIEQKRGLAAAPVYGTVRDICFSFYYTAVGDTASLPSWISSCHTEPGHCLGGGIIMEYIACARSAAAQKQFFKLENIARHIESMAQARQSAPGEIMALVFLAAASFNSGRLDEARNKLEQAWNLAEPDKLYGLFMEESALLLPLAQKLAQNSSEDLQSEDWLNTLLPQLKAAQRKRNQLAVAYAAVSARASGRKETQLAVMLSKREKEVLNYLSEGITGREMARIMEVSVNNIKGITTRVYNKLSVCNKTEAIRVAQELGLL